MKLCEEWRDDEFNIEFQKKRGSEKKKELECILYIGELFALPMFASTLSALP